MGERYTMCNRNYLLKDRSLGNEMRHGCHWGVSSFSVKSYLLISRYSWDVWGWAELNPVQVQLVKLSRLIFMLGSGLRHESWAHASPFENIYSTRRVSCLHSFIMQMTHMNNTYTLIHDHLCLYLFT